MSKELQVESFIPHRKPMLLVDKIISGQGDEIFTETKIDPQAFFLQGHYPGFPIVPGVILCECLFQSASILLSKKQIEKTASPGNGIPVVARIENAKFKAPVFPGDVVSFKVRLKEQMGGAYYFYGEAKVLDKIKASVDFACMWMPENA